MLQVERMATWTVYQMADKKEAKRVDLRVLLMVVLSVSIKAVLRVDWKVDWKAEGWVAWKGFLLADMTALTVVVR